VTSDIRASIVAEVRQDGPISFARYMEMALYAPGGYYDRPPIGTDGDFVTSPHVHPVFSRLVGKAMHELWLLAGSPDPFRVTEVGAGDGRLAADLLASTVELPWRYVAVERSRGAREELAQLSGVSVAEELTGDPHVVLAHELLDNLPFRRIRATAEGPREVRIGLRDEHLVEVLTETGDDLPPAADGLDPDDEAIHPDGALAFIDELAQHLGHGYALLIDYGGLGSAGGNPHGYRGHQVIEDLLADPGATDITAGVDFVLISARAKSHGLEAFPVVTQRHVLTSLGFERWIREELERQAKLLNEREGAAAVRAWSGRSRATLLVDPTALGRHKWLLLASPGLPAPSWLAPDSG
jgi:NADH dehydrogenase [ubiquinone] 1 alpha subcomplex assembly factor 7